MEGTDDENSNNSHGMGKRKSHPENYMQNMIKKSRVAGEAYISHRGRQIAELRVGEPCK